MAAVFLDTVVLDQPLERAMSARRIHHNGNPDVVFHEEGVTADILSSLGERGNQVSEAGILGRVAAVWCPAGLPAEPDTCQAAVDTRSSGLAVVLSDGN
jgi:gamma-glutamyltranspeptidase